MTSDKKPNRALHITVWVVQILLALSSLMAGFMKSFTPLDQLGQQMTWVATVPPYLTRIAGVSELLIGLGLILPSVLRIMPKLSGIAALGLVGVMIPAAIVHLRIDEPIVVNIVMALMAGFVAWGRLVKAPIRPK